MEKHREIAGMVCVFRFEICVLCFSEEVDRVMLGEQNLRPDKCEEAIFYDQGLSKPLHIRTERRIPMPLGKEIP